MTSNWPIFMAQLKTDKATPQFYARTGNNF